MSRCLDQLLQKLFGFGHDPFSREQQLQAGAAQLFPEDCRADASQQQRPDPVLGVGILQKQRLALHHDSRRDIADALPVQIGHGSNLVAMIMSIERQLLLRLLNALGNDVEGILVFLELAGEDEQAQGVFRYLQLFPVRSRQLLAQCHEPELHALDTAVKPNGPLPLTVLPSGLYFRSETGGLILLGKSLDEDPVGFNFSWDDKRFMELLWPELAEFVPAFDRLKLVRGWAGLYAVNTMDENAILGQWPELKGLYLANGFSGHGLQQAPAVGRYLAELILGNPHELDLSIFHPLRILENKPLSEGGLV